LREGERADFKSGILRERERERVSREGERGYQDDCKPKGGGGKSKTRMRTYI